MAVEDAHRLAEELVAACRRTLPPLAGAILHGSLASGDFVPGKSDVDVLTIVESRPSDDQLSALTVAVSSLRGDAAAPADLRVVTSARAAAPTPSPPMEAYIRIDPGCEPGLEVETRSPGERDLVVELSVCRSLGRSLLGPAPTELIGDVPDAWVVDVGAAVLADWRRQDYDRAMAKFTVFTTCRIWRFAEERVHCSKREAGAWTLRRDPSLTVVRKALHDERLDEQEVRDLLSRVQA